MNTSNTDECLEYKMKTKYADGRLRNEISKKYNIEFIKELSKHKRDNVIREIKGFTGTRNRELSNVLSIGRGIIGRELL